MLEKKRIAAVGLVFSLCFSMCSCRTQKKSTVKVISKEDTWYESIRFDLEYELAKDQMLTGCSVSYVNDRICMLYSTYDMESYEFENKICMYDDGGNKTSDVKVSYDGRDGNLQDISVIIPDADGKTATALAQVHKAGFKSCFLKMDISSGKVLDSSEIVVGDGKNISDEGSTISMYPVGEYYAIVSMKEANLSRRVHFYKGMEFVSEMDMASLGIVQDVTNFVFDDKSGNIFVNVVNDQSLSSTCTVDPKSGRIVKNEIWDVDFMRSDHASDYSYSREGELLRLDSLGNIYKMDPTSGKSSVVISNSEYNPYFYEYTEERNQYERKVLSRTDDKVVLSFAGESFDAFLDFDTEYSVTILKKQETNPHAGKKVVEISMPTDGYFSDYLSMAIYNFNKTDEEYLIKIWSKHNEGFKGGFKYPANFSIDPNYSLILELKSDDCPDLVMDIRKLDAMKDDILVDLQDYLDENVKAELFDNVLSASKINGKSYLIPVTIKVEGIVANRELLGSDKKGFTFEEYDAFVNEKLNGAQAYDYVDSEYYNRDSFVRSCLDVKSAIEGDQVNFDSEQFRKAAEYAKGHFFENSFTGLSDANSERTRPAEEGKYVIMTSVRDFILRSNTDKPVYTAYGTPDVNGAGPRFTSAESISVAARSDNKEGSRKFLNYLFSGDFMEEKTILKSICTNKNVMASSVPKYLEKNNACIKELDDGFMMMESIYSLGFKSVDVKAVTENFLDIISHLSAYYLDEPDITNIVMEELAPYYAGDRSIDDAIKYINDRVGKYISESK